MNIAMPRAILPLDQFKENIRYWIFEENLSNIEIAHRISVRLDKPCSFRTIENRLRDWGFNRRNHVKDSTELRLRIAVLFQQSYSDQNIVRQLEREDLGPISARQVAIIRKKIGFVRRMSVYERARADQQLVQLVREELDTGIIESYGRSLLEKWFRQKGVSTTRFACTTF
jgi:hypothetical protein